MKHFRISIEIDITARNREHAERRLSLLCSDIERHSWVTAALLDGIEERIAINPRKDIP
jgi:hypothetical protein